MGDGLSDGPASFYNHAFLGLMLMRRAGTGDIGRTALAAIRSFHRCCHVLRLARSGSRQRS